MLSHPGFIRSICENPADDTPRLIYADWLEDNGEDERAEFIRVQCELAKVVEPHPCGFTHGAHGCWVCRLKDRERQLLILVRPYFIYPGVGLVWDRGFVSGVQCAAQDWEQHAGAICFEHPIERVTLTSLGPARGWVENDGGKDTWCWWKEGYGRWLSSRVPPYLWPIIGPKRHAAQGKMGSHYSDELSL